MWGQQQLVVTSDRQEPYAIDLVLSTLAGNEQHMPTNLAYCEDLSELEDEASCQRSLISRSLAAKLTS